MALGINKKDNYMKKILYRYSYYYFCINRYISDFAMHCIRYYADYC